MPTIFTRIINGELPAHKILEDEKFLAFLDIRPIKPGHTLVIPKREINYLFDMGNDQLGEMMVFCKQAAAALKRSVPCARVGIMVAGLEVPHAHIHLIPFDAIPDLAFANARPMDPEKLAALAEKIRSNL